jgi:uncharacterized phiE125 gp8 family phage protein
MNSPNRGGWNSIQRIAEPAIEPVGLAEIKAHLRLTPDFADDDGYILSVVSAARRMVESRTGRTLTETRWRGRLIPPFGTTVAVPMPPLIVDPACPVRIIRDNGPAGFAVVDPDSYWLDPYSFPGQIVFGSGYPGSGSRGLVVEWFAGHRSAAETPFGLRQAVMGLAAHFYENRETVSAEGSAAVIPQFLDALLAADSWDGRY